jgi:Flp pilus assembly protein TadG
MTITSRRRRGESGQAFVELALVLPVLLLILLGIIQFGTVFRDYIALTDATRVGARQASVARSIQPESSRIPLVIAKVQKAAINLDSNRMSVTVEPVMLDGVTPGWEASGDVTVNSTYPFRVTMFGIVLFDGVLKSRTTERVE